MTDKVEEIRRKYADFDEEMSDAEFDEVAYEWVGVLLNRISELENVQREHNKLLSIMDRARRLALPADDEETLRPRFKMDANGNLTRLDDGVYD